MAEVISLKSGQLVGPGRFTLIKEPGHGGTDEVMLFNRALNAAEICALYDAQN